MVTDVQVTDASLVDLLETVLNSPYANTLVRQFILTAAAKLSARFAELGTASSSTQQDRIAVLLAGFSGNLELEIQQRAVEFGSLFTRADVRAGVLERMPPPEIRATIMGTGECHARTLHGPH
jgi:AP-1 complex subunit gamma-1